MLGIIVKHGRRKLFDSLQSNSGRLEVTWASACYTPASSASTSGRLSIELLPSVARQATRALGRQSAQLQFLHNELRGQKEFFLRQLERVESRLVNSGRSIANSVSCSHSGQKVVAIGVPLLANSVWGSPAALCHSHDRRVPFLVNGRPPKAEANRVFTKYLDAFREEVWTFLRGCYLVLLFTPVVLTAPICVGLELGRDWWVELVRWTLERAGPAFIKWGQWAATRPDLFPPDICKALTKLHTGAPSHSYAFTRHAIEHAFKRDMDDIFADFEVAPVASGSIAQVHRGVLSTGGAFGSTFKPGTVVAVKVRHPGVTMMMQRDFTLMHRAAMICTKLPLLKDLRLDESVRQFGGPLKEQLDLSTEANALARFNRNFRSWRNLSFPSPVFPLVAPDVLVETFEPGRLISRYVDSPNNRHNVALASLGLNGYLKMLLNDNFIHADLHPGNILVRVVDPNSLWGRVANYFGFNTAPHLVLLDVGMTAELTPEDQGNLIQFFKAITSQDGRSLGENILGFSENQTCPNPAAFVEEMANLFANLDADAVSERTSEIMGEMMEKIRRHQVNLKGIVSTVVVTTLVLEGWSTKLDPEIKILDALRKTLPMPFHERLAKTVDDVMNADYCPTVV